MTEAASRFLAKLTPADRVGLIAFPGAGPNIDFTSNHAIVQKALPGLTGLADSFPTTIGSASRSDGDRPGQPDRPNAGIAGAANTSEERDLCIEAGRDRRHWDLQRYQRAHTDRLATLRSIVERLSQTSTPKTIVYISEGLILERWATAPGWPRPRHADK